MCTLFLERTKNQIWATSWQTQQCGCAPSEDSAQPGHLPSLISVFAVRMKKAWVLSYPLSASEDSDQTGQMPRLIWVFAGCKVILLILSWGGSYLQGGFFTCLKLLCMPIQRWKTSFTCNHLKLLFDQVCRYDGGKLRSLECTSWRFTSKQPAKHSSSPWPLPPTTAPSPPTAEAKRSSCPADDIKVCTEWWEIYGWRR